MENNITYRVAPNIALIKYWGKYNEELILPWNSNISFTLGTEDLYSETSVSFSNGSEDELILNGKTFAINSRVNRLLERLRNKAAEHISKRRIKIISSNNFPTAAGLASSSSGYAALALCLFDLFQLKESFPGEKSELARLGSGSACRSIYGGLNIWEGYTKYKENINSEECIARNIQPSTDFEDLQILIIGEAIGEKEVSSTDGMKTTTQTSELFKRRLEVVEGRLELLMGYLKTKDYNNAFEIIMKDSNEFHAICLDTFPPLFYMNEFTKNLIKAIHEFNEVYKKNKIAYTVDAGPHVTIIGKIQEIQEFIKVLIFSFNTVETWERNQRFNSTVNSLMSEGNTIEKNDESISQMDMRFLEVASIIRNQNFKKVFTYLTVVGNGPQRM